MSLHGMALSPYAFGNHVNCIKHQEWILLAFFLTHAYTKYKKTLLLEATLNLLHQCCKTIKHENFQGRWGETFLCTRQQVRPMIGDGKLSAG